MRETEALVKSTATHMFGKTLTDIDANNYGGFLVPRQGAEDCFPPLSTVTFRIKVKIIHGSLWQRIFMA
ncbi:Auxin response factor 14 [Glycine soja]